MPSFTTKTVLEEVKKTFEVLEIVIKFFCEDFNTQLRFNSSLRKTHFRRLSMTFWYLLHGVFRKIILKIMFKKATKMGFLKWKSPSFMILSSWATTRFEISLLLTEDNSLGLHFEILSSKYPDSFGISRKIQPGFINYSLMKFYSLLLLTRVIRIDSHKIIRFNLCTYSRSRNLNSVWGSVNNSRHYFRLRWI